MGSKKSKWQEDDFLGRAFYFALKAHDMQVRKGTGQPYIDHPMNVATMLMDLGADREIVAAGFLHDVVEDTGLTMPELRKAFGPRVAKLVEEVSEDKTKDWEERKQKTIDYLRTAPQEVLLLSLADKLDNLRSIAEDYDQSGEEIWTRFARPRDSQKWYYQNLSDVFTKRLTETELKKFVDEFALLVAAVFK